MRTLVFCLNRSGHEGNDRTRLHTTVEDFGYEPQQNDQVKLHRQMFTVSGRRIEPHPQQTLYVYLSEPALPETVVSICDENWLEKITYP